MKKIIVPTDFSECAKNALKVASDIVRRGGGEIHLIHIYKKPVWGFAEANLDIIKNRKLHDWVEKQLHLTASLGFLKKLTVKKHIFTDVTVWEALNSKTFSDANLVVMGSYGVSGLHELFIGSTTEKVVRYCPTPILIIKQWIEDFKIENMVFASDFSAEAGIMFGKIENLAAMFHAKIHLLKVITPSIFEPTYESINTLGGFIRKFYCTECTSNVYNDKTVEDGIVNFSRQINADIIVIGTHGRTGLSHIINGSVTEDLVNHINKPVLTMKIINSNSLPLQEIQKQITKK